MAKRLGVAVSILVLAVSLGIYALLAASLPRRTGEAAVPGLAARLSIDLDAHAIPSIHAASFTDALRAQGYMHAQERFFEMDLLRRAPSGELAALFGERALASDLAQKPFEFRDARTRVAGRAAGRARRVARRVHGRRQRGAFGPARPPARVLAVRRTTRGVAERRQPARRVRVLHDAVEQRCVRADAGIAARRRTRGPVRVPDAVDLAVRPAACRCERRRSDRRIQAARHSDERHDRFARQRRTGRKPHAARRPAITRPRVEPVGGRPVAWRGRTRVARERSASRVARAEYVLPQRARMAGRCRARSRHSGIARHPDRRERRARVGRDGQQRGSGRLGRRRIRPCGREPLSHTRRVRGVRRAYRRRRRRESRTT